MGQFNIGLVKHAYIKIVVSGHLLILNWVFEFSIEQPILFDQDLVRVLRLILLIDQLLFFLDVLEHILGLREAHVVGKDLTVGVIKWAQLRQSLLWFEFTVRSFEKFVYVIKYEVVLKDCYCVTLLVVDQVINNFQLVEFRLHFSCDALKAILKSFLQ
jgi:hypothetical protein